MIKTFGDTFQDFIYFRTYSRWIEEKGRREFWNESVERYENFFIQKVPNAKKKEFKTACKAILDIEVMGSMRALWTAGKALERDHICLYNCAYTPIDSIKSFSELLYILMCFSPETLIKTKNGDKKISELSYADEVLSYDETKKLFEYIKPSNIVETPSAEKEKIELELENGYIFRCTSDHKLLTTNRGWVAAKNLNEEDDIKNFHEIQ